MPRPVLPHPTDVTLALVQLTRGYFAVVSVIDAAEVARLGWCVSGDRRYAVASARSKEYLHQFIGRRMGIAGKVDHENGNGLDCRRSNLRRATAAQNSQNSRRRNDNTSGVKGVYWDEATRKWRAAVQVNGRVVRLGRFADLDEAEHVVRAARERLHKEFANHGGVN